MNTLETFRLTAEARKRKKEEKKQPKSPKAQNMTMEEAFYQTMEQNPESPIAQIIETVSQSQESERLKQKEKEQFTQLKELFIEVGSSWFRTRIDQSTTRPRGYDSIPIEQKKMQWAQALTSLRDKPSEQRIELLSAIASGMNLRENNYPTLDAKYGRIFLFSPFDDLNVEHSGTTFTQPSIFFMEGISDISGHSKEQKQEFDDFMTKKSGLIGTVELPQLFTGISRWIDLTYNNSPLSTP